MPLNIWPAGWGGEQRKEQQIGVANIPNVLKGQNVLIPTGFGTAATNQKEGFKYKEPAGVGYEEIYTVPAGKIWYVTTLIIQNVGGGILLATGAAASEVDFLGATTAFAISMTTPIKFLSGTRVSIKGQNSNITLIGWEE